MIDATAPAEGGVHTKIPTALASQSHETGQRKIRQLAGNNLITIDWPPIRNEMPQTVRRAAHRCPRLLFGGKSLRANRFRVLVGAGGDAEEMNTARDFVVVDVETSGFDPAAARVLSVAALTITAGGSTENSWYTLLDPGVDPGPTNIHGLTPTMLAGQPCYADIAEHLAPLLRGRILVAHNAAFDYAFLAAEARRCGTELPVTSVLCTLELAGLLDLDLEPQPRRPGPPLEHPPDPPPRRPRRRQSPGHVLRHALARASELENTLPIRPPATLPPVEFHTAAA